MKMLRKILVSVFCSCIWLVLPAQEERGLVRQGNQRYIEGKWDEAEAEYNKALSVNNNLPESVFNLGDVAYQKQDFQKAATQFETAAMLATDNQQKAKAYHNLGNSYLEAKQFDKSVEAYKNALRLNPADMDTKYNLAYAQQMLKKNSEQQQQNQDKENQEDKEKKEQEKKQQDQNQDQQNKEQQQKEGEKKEEQNQQDKQANEQKGEEKDAQQQQGQPKQAQLSKEDAQRLLEALMQQEQKVQQQIINKKLPPEKKTTEKDW